VDLSLELILFNMLINGNGSDTTSLEVTFMDDSSLGSVINIRPTSSTGQGQAGCLLAALDPWKSHR